MDGRAWWATVHRVAKSRTRLSDFTPSLIQLRQEPRSPDSQLSISLHGYGPHEDKDQKRYWECSDPFPLSFNEAQKIMIEILRRKLKSMSVVTLYIKNGKQSFLYNHFFKMARFIHSFIQVFLSKTLTCRLVNSWLAIMILKTRNQKGFVLTAANMKQSLWLYMTSWSVVGFPGGASGKEPTCQCRKHKRCRFNPWVGNILWQRAWQPTLVLCLENLMNRGAWGVTAHGVAKNRIWLTD